MPKGQYLAAMTAARAIARLLPVGTRFHTLTVVSPVKASVRWDYMVRCDCGVTKVMRKGNLLRAKSCGCMTNALISHARTRHGESHGPTWRSWKSMIDRCTLTCHKSWKDYGGRGITVCDSWLSRYENFRADMGERPLGTQLDRVDNACGYTPANCRWSTPRQNANNRRSNKSLKHNGETLTVSQWARRTGISPDTLFKRVESGWATSDVICRPLRGQRNNRGEPSHRITSRLVKRGDAHVAEYRLERS